jgi:hypothetical protein
MTTKVQMREYAKTMEQFSLEAPGLTWSHIQTLVDHLHRYETTLHRIAENDCNGHPRMKTEIRDGKRCTFEVEDPEWAARDAKKEARIQKNVRAIAQELGFSVQFNGDPRGGAIRFVLPSGASNGDGETWGIYW